MRVGEVSSVKMCHLPEYASLERLELRYIVGAQEGACAGKCAQDAGAEEKHALKGMRKMLVPKRGVPKRPRAPDASLKGSGRGAEKQNPANPPKATACPEVLAC